MLKNKAKTNGRLFISRWKLSMGIGAGLLMLCFMLSLVLPASNGSLVYLYIFGFFVSLFLMCAPLLIFDHRWCDRNIFGKEPYV